MFRGLMPKFNDWADMVKAFKKLEPEFEKVDAFWQKELKGHLDFCQKKHAILNFAME